MFAVLGPTPLPDLGPIQPFGLLVAIGVLLASRIVLRRTLKQGFDEEDVRRASLVLVLGAFLLSHWVERVYYVPGPALSTGPWELLYFWNGMSSFGGFAGALYGLLLYTGWGKLSPRLRGLVLALPFAAVLTMYASVEAAQLLVPVAFAVSLVLLRRGVHRIVLADAFMESIVFGWIFGRMGCTVVFDHPGAPSQFFLAQVYSDGIARFNLGMMELLVTLLLLLPVTLFLRWRKAGPGVLTGVICMLYAPARFGLDFMRTHTLSGADPRFLGMTAAQYGTIAMFLAGVAILMTRPRSEEAIAAAMPTPVAAQAEVKKSAGKRAGTKGEGSKAKGKAKNKAKGKKSGKR